VRKATIAVGILCAATWAAGGDYRLVIADDRKDPCVPAPAASGHPDWPVVSAQEVSEDILRYSRGERPRLELFVPFFTNARITFCKPSDRHKVYETLVASLQLARFGREWDLYDYCFMLGSPELVAMLDSAVDQKPTDAALKRIRRARSATLRGIKARNARG
jgi:hypothetical protein